MDSSVAVFSNQANPFSEQSKTKGHYHPSRARPLTPEQKQTVLSPARLHPGGASCTRPSDDSLSPPDLHFLKGSQHLVAGPPDSAGSSSPFDESWPSTEISSSKTPEGAAREAMPEWTAEGWGSPSHATHDVSGLSEDTETPPTDGSVIAKYMQRFRHGRPSSRKERSVPMPQEGKHFWWLHSSPEERSSPGDQPSRSTGRRMTSEYGVPEWTGKSPIHATQNESQLSVKGHSPKEGDVGTSQLFPADQETLRLQERAARLLQRSESSLSSTIPVSSEGLGSSPLSCTTQSEEEAVRRPFLQSLTDYSTAPVVGHRWPKTMMAHQPVLVPSSCRPEEDILFQWRLRRKMEQARDGTLPVTSRRKSLSPPVRLSKRAEDGPEVRVPGTALQRGARGDSMAAPSPITFAHHVPGLVSEDHPHSQLVPPHWHHFCDILPCPHQAEHPCESRTGTARRGRDQTLEDRGTGRERSGSPQETSSDEPSESSLDLTPAEHSPAECGQESRPTRAHDHRKQSPHDMPCTWHKFQAHSDSGSRTWSSEDTRQELAAPGMKKETENKPSTSNAKPLKAQPKRASTPGATQGGAISSHQGSERRRVLYETPQETTHRRVKARVSVLEEETIRHRARGGERVLEEATRMQEATHHRARERDKALPEKTGGRETAYHQQRVRHGALAEETGAQEASGRERRAAPADSPVRNILGQVISERLFSPPASPKPVGGKSKRQPFNRRHEPSPTTSHAAEPPHPQPLEVATQLLEDAEDSDGTEFEEDPLLQVLRERRNAILQRLRHVDLCMAKLQTSGVPE